MDGPLKNLLVVDLTRVLVGPYCTMILSDLGARVIKVEAPEIGDDSRKFGPFVEDYSAYFMSLNRGKESIALNLKNSDDKKIFDKILFKADILVENFKPGTLKKWGYGWEEVNKKFPSTIIVTIFETKPIAKLIKNKKKYLLDSSSNLILINKDLKVDKLPNIFGENAENNFVIFLDKLKSNNFPLKKIKNFYFFQIGRWDLELNNKKVIKLPNNKIDEAIKKSVKLLNRNDFNKYYIIDLRVDGKVIVE